MFDPSKLHDEVSKVDLIDQFNIANEVNEAEKNYLGEDFDEVIAQSSKLIFLMKLLRILK